MKKRQNDLRQQKIHDMKLKQSDVFRAARKQADHHGAGWVRVLSDGSIEHVDTRLVRFLDPNKTALK